MNFGKHGDKHMNNLQRKMGTFSLTMVGLGSIIGSGWLFGAWRAAQIAGPRHYLLDYWDGCYFIYRTFLQ